MSAHVPALHVADAFAPLGHSMPHRPQLAVDAFTSVSQPLESSMSQLPRPIVHAIEQAPATHVAVPPMPPHVRRHEPQFIGSVDVSASQPFAAFPSQS